MSYVYKKSEPGLWTVGTYDPDKKWRPESDHNSEKLAEDRVHFLNGDFPSVEFREKVLEEAEQIANHVDVTITGFTSPHDASVRTAVAIRDGIRALHSKKCWCQRPNSNLPHFKNCPALTVSNSETYVPTIPSNAALNKLADDILRQVVCCCGNYRHHGVGWMPEGSGEGKSVALKLIVDALNRGLKENAWWNDFAPSESVRQGRRENS